MKKTNFTNFLSKGWVKMAVLPMFFLASLLWVQDVNGQDVVLGEVQASNVLDQISQYEVDVETSLKVLKANNDVDGFNNNLMLLNFYKTFSKSIRTQKPVSQHVVNNLQPAQLLPILLTRAGSIGTESSAQPTSKQ